MFESLSHLVKAFPEKLRIPAPVGIRRCQYFHGFLSFAEAEELLKGKAIGTYLLRFSRSEPGSLVVAFVGQRGTVEQCIAKPHKAGYLLGHYVYSSIDDIIRSNPSQLMMPLLTTQFDSGIQELAVPARPPPPLAPPSLRGLSLGVGGAAGLGLVHGLGGAGNAMRPSSSSLSGASVQDAGAAPGPWTVDSSSLESAYSPMPTQATMAAMLLTRQGGGEPSAVGAFSVLPPAVPPNPALAPAPSPAPTLASAHPSVTPAPAPPAHVHSYPLTLQQVLQVSPRPAPQSVVGLYSTATATGAVGEGGSGYARALPETHYANISNAVVHVQSAVPYDARLLSGHAPLPSSTPLFSRNDSAMYINRQPSHDSLLSSDSKHFVQGTSFFEDPLQTPLATISESPQARLPVERSFRTVAAPSAAPLPTSTADVRMSVPRT